MNCRDDGRSGVVSREAYPAIRMIIAGERRTTLHEVAIAMRWEISKTVYSVQGLTCLSRLLEPDRPNRPEEPERPDSRHALRNVGRQDLTVNPFVGAPTSGGNPR
jgi:hypothetical protein